ncbi:helicase DnaB [Parabacteroides sp. 52]|uniref:DnaB-like helicase C-terminal domain-containing protein n=1 Tax=unclassified Parabacteroides TaxID=2649774 RepID=UPI0013D038E3|nr:DnaB-like helicase C-terminal domain-containing protein [Parabacteroides sp. PM5-20]MDH6533675.1 replicative DNA helicase [Parabacteroides sp. PM5-20]NDV54427.1 helicase DnaB [Parabacteroides sp. 52]
MNTSEISTKSIREIMQTSVENKATATVYNTGYHSVDNIMGGLKKGELIVVGAKTAMGKTGFAISLIKNMFNEKKIPICYFSLESSSQHMVNRFFSIFCDIDTEKLYNQELSADITDKVEEFGDLPIYIDDTALATIDDIAYKIRKVVIEHHVEIVVIDYLQRIYSQLSYNENRYSEINYFMRILKSLSMELKIPIIVLSELNRNSGHKAPQLSDLRDSGTICEDADTVCFLHRPEYYGIFEDERGNSMSGVAEFIIAKNRNGETGTARLKFDKKNGGFANLENNR